MYTVYKLFPNGKDIRAKLFRKRYKKETFNLLVVEDYLFR